MRSKTPELVRGALGGEHFQEYFFADCKCEEIAGEVRKILELV